MAISFADLSVVLAGILLWGVAFMAWRRREEPAADQFAAVAVIGGTGVLAVGSGLAVDLPRAFVLASVVSLALVLPLLWLKFAFEYTGRNELNSTEITATIAIVPGLGLLVSTLIFGSQLVPWLDLPSRQAASGLVAIGIILLTTVQWLALLYTGAVVLAANGLLWLIFRRYDHLDPTAGTLLVTFGTIPWLSLLVGLQVASIDPAALSKVVTIGFVIGGVAAGTVLVRYRPFRELPAAGNVGPATVIEELDDIMIVTGGEGTIVEMNPIAERTVGAATDEVIGTDIGELLDIPLEDLRGTETVELHSKAGRRLFEPNVSELTDQHDLRLGYAIVLRDVTSQTVRRQRLEVLNRVLRHNLRNEMNVIVGHTQMLKEGVADPDLKDSAESVLETSWNLIDLSDSARETENIMAAAKQFPTDVQLSPLTADVLTDIAGEYEVTTECSVPSDLVVVGTESLLRLALSTLVQDAIERFDGDDPRVGIHTSYDPDRTYPLAILMISDGPGIPDSEWQVIEEGTETSLQHATGLRLWSADWAVTHLGGEIDIETGGEDESVVSIRLPRARRAEETLDGTPPDR